MPIKYVPYSVEPVAGQAVLNNFNRVLKYKGSNDLDMRVERGMPYYTVELKESIGNSDSKNMVFRGDCLSACAYLKDRGIKIDLVYIDPPFMSGADYAKKIILRKNPLNEEIQEYAESLDLDELRKFEEKVYGDIWDKEKYLSWMYENLLAIRSVMSEKGSIYVHLDWHIGHYVKIILDEIFGEENYRNEIIWQRANAHSDSKQGAIHFGRMHDVIYFYALSEESEFNMQYTPYDDDYIEQYYKRIEEGTGRRYWLDNLQGPGGASKGNPYYEVMGIWRYWRFSKERMDQLIKEGRVVQTSPGTVPKYKRYLDEMPGKPVQDVWSDVKSLGGLGSKVNERIDYTTQKPEALLERIINVSSSKGMMVADFFGGSGVTAAVANRLERNFIHVDVGINSIQIVRDRLIQQKASFNILEIDDGISLFRNPIQTMEKIKTSIIGLKNEDGLDKFWEGVISDPRYGTIPVYVPDLGDSSTRILDKVLMRRIIYEAIPDLDPGIKRVIVYYVDITSKEEIEKYISDQEDLKIVIELRDLKTLLDDFVVEDDVQYEYIEDRSNLLGHAIRIDRFYSDAVDRRIKRFNLESKQNDKKGNFKPIELSENGLELIEYVSLDYNNREGLWHSDYEIKIDINSNVIRNGEKTKDFWDGKIPCDRKPARMKIRNICGDETVLVLE